MFIQRRLQSIIGILSLVLCFYNGIAQQKERVIKYLGVQQGLSNNVVNSLYQDRFGFMWMGTYDGLNRYDGYNFKVYRNKWDDDYSLANNHITCLNGDGHNRIWIGTQKGISFFDYTDSQLHAVSYLENGKSVKISAAVAAIAIGKTGTVYFTTDEKGLFAVKKGERRAERIPFNGKVNFTARGLAADQSELWVFIKDVGLCQYREQTKKFTVVNSTISAVTTILNRTPHTLWIGTEKGLYTFQKNTRTLERLPLQLSSNNIMGLTLDHEQNVWVATDGGGINIIAKDEKTVKSLTASSEKGLTSNSIGAVYEDKENRKWIATLRGGINIIDNVQVQFQTIKRDPFKSNTLINNFILSFCEDLNQDLWIGTDGGGLSLWNPNTNTFTNFIHRASDPYSLSSNFVTSILKDHKDQIWVTTFNGGIDRFDRNTRTFKHYICYNSIKGVEEVNVWKIFQDQTGRLWVGTTKGEALYLYHPEKDRFELFDERLKDIHTFYQDSQGQLWAGDYTHLIKLDPIHKKHEYISVKSAVRAILEDRYKQLWIGTEGGGLLHLDRRSKKITRFIESDGLSNNSVLNMLEDNSGNIWCSTYNGLSKFNLRRKTFKNYYATDGLQSNQFSYNAALRLRNGELLFGGINGFNKFSPDQIQVNKRIPKLVINDFRVNNVPIDEDPKQQSLSVVDLKQIAIPFDAAVISVNFSAIEFSFQDQIKYAYYLEGWDRDWNYVDKRNTAYYSRLNEGTYKLRLKSTDTEGTWTKNERVIIIKILPPWYRTWWAYTAYFLIFSSAYYIFVKYRRRQDRLKHEVEIANLKMEREKDLNEKKLNFFTNISHELRTPLTLIVNPIKDILRTKEDGTEKNDLNVVYRNSKRLLSLVDQLLLFRRTESETTSLNLVKINLLKFAREIFLCFNYLAKNNNIDYTFEAEEEELFICADRDKLEIVLFNLLSNAIKFTPKGGAVKLSIFQVEGYVQFKVSDTGPGIPENVGDKLFDKFYKVINNASLKVGFGIGLYLVKNFVELHHGDIAYTTKIGEGTTFTIKLPIGTQQVSDVPEHAENELNYVNELMAEQEDELNEVGPAANLELLISDLNSILVVDDNETIIEYIDQIFHQHFKIYKAANGNDGLRLCQEYLPDIVISDVNMDGLNGVELCKAIKDDPSLSHIPVILLTADPSPEMKLKGIEVGAYDFISKPFDRELFLAKINSVMKNRTNLQSYFYNEITLKSDPHKVSQEAKTFLQKCITIIENNLIEEEFSVKTLASDLGMSHSNLYKKIKTTSGMSINSFIRFIRLRKAAELLINTNLNVNEAAFRVGINDIKYFRAQFQLQFKLTPSEFIKKHRKTFHKYYHVNTTL